MKQKKKSAVWIAIALILTVGLAACSTSDKQGSESSSRPPSGSQPASEKAQSSEASWAEANGLNRTETSEELYEKAKKEGTVVVYSQSSRIKNVKADFEKKYPGVTVEAYYMDTLEIAEKITREYNSDVFNADVVFAKDAGGIFTKELLKERGMIHKYMPEDIVASMAEPYKTYDGLVPYLEARTIFYNTEAYKESPIKNWWDLTTPEWKGKVIISDPTNSAETLDLFLAFVKHADEMAEAYKEKFGSDIVLDGTENAGYEFIKRLLKNDLVLIESSGEVVKAVGTPGQKDPPVGIAVSSRIRDAADKKLNLAFTYDVKPKASHAELSLLYVADQSPHPNAAKLLIRFMAGEADGKGEGLKSFNVIGAWMPRSDVEATEKLPLTEMKLWPYDAEFNYLNSIKVRDFWISQK